MVEVWNIDHMIRAYTPEQIESTRDNLLNASADLLKASETAARSSKRYIDKLHNSTFDAYKAFAVAWLIIDGSFNDGDIPMGSQLIRDERGDRNLVFPKA